MTEKEYVESLKERDKAKPLKKIRLTPGSKPLPGCPNCGDVLILVKSDMFCRKCGQRLMTDAWEF